MRTRLFAAAVLVLTACGGLKLKPDSSLAPASVSVTRVERAVDNVNGKTVSAYLVFDKPFAGAVEMRLFDRDDAKGVEVGRSVVRVNEPSGAHYVDFIFDPRTPVYAAAAAQVKAVAAAGAEEPSDGGAASVGSEDGGTASTDGGTAVATDAGTP
jgi:hypothetical protein